MNDSFIPNFCDQPGCLETRLQRYRPPGSPAIYLCDFCASARKLTPEKPNAVSPFAVAETPFNKPHELREWEPKPRNPIAARVHHSRRDRIVRAPKVQSYATQPIGVEALDKDGAVLSRHASIKRAWMELGISQRQITRSARERSEVPDRGVWIRAKGETWTPYSESARRLTGNSIREVAA